jgi:hypothetical protein
MTKTLTKPKLEATVESLGNIYRVEAPFDEALEALTAQNARIISARDLAYARISQGEDSFPI